MTTNTAEATVATAEIQEVKKNGRDRLQYRFNAVVGEMRELVQERDVDLEDLRAEIAASLADDGVIDAGEAATIERMLFDVFASNASELLITTLLDESSLEAAQRAAERSAIKRQKRAKTGRGRR